VTGDSQLTSEASALTSEGRNPANARKFEQMTAASNDANGAENGRSQDKSGTARLSINLSTETADAFKEPTGRKGLTLTEGIRRAIIVLQFVEDETSRGNQIAVIEQDGSIRKVVLL
jgi:hypothetical protein